MTRCLRFLWTVDFRRIAWIAVLLGACGGIIYWVATDYIGAAVFQIVGWSLVVSRVTAMMMLPVFSLCLLAICRRTMTLLRATPLNYIISVDDAVSFHQWMGGLGVFLATLHSLCHIANFISAKNEVEYSELYFKAPGAAAGLVWNPCVTVTGCLMLLGMALALPFAFKWPKQASWLRETPVGKVLNNFNMFYITHQIFSLTFVILFMIHPVPGHSHVRGKRTYLPLPYSWMWIAWPLALYIGERIYGLFRAHYWDTQVMGASMLDSGVLTLELTKPQGFSYIPGQYVLIQCGDISAYEWHPFSLTSAPEDNFLQVHINNAGDWTGALHARFCALMQLTHAAEGDLLESVAESLKERNAINSEEHGLEQQLPAITSSKQIADDGCEAPASAQGSTRRKSACFERVIGMVEASQQAVQQRRSMDSFIQPALVPAKSYISYMQSPDYGSQLQRMQALRMKDSAEAWEGMQGPDSARRFMQRMSSDKLRRLESALQRSSSLTAPSQAPKLRIDGPFGSPAQEHAKFKKVLLIGMGTGIAPMLSIMRDTLHRLATLPSDPPGLQADDKTKKVEQRRAYMHWVVRDPRAASWLKYEFEIMSLLDVTGSVFTSHVHVTGGQTAEAPPSEQRESDPQLHPNVKLTNGRPDFEAILQNIQGEVGKARVGVFLCGPHSARVALRKQCARLTTAGQTTFIFHAERF